jgi:hypothetical protein
MEAGTLKEDNVHQKNKTNQVHNKHASLPIPSCSAVIRSIFASLLSSPDPPGADVPAASSACCSAAILSSKLLAEVINEQSLQYQDFDSRTVMERLMSGLVMATSDDHCPVDSRHRYRFEGRRFQAGVCFGFCVPWKTCVVVGGGQTVSGISEYRSLDFSF